jgi:hypothetical protein
VLNADGRNVTVEGALSDRLLVGIRDGAGRDTGLGIILKADAEGGLELLTPVASAGIQQLRAAGFELDEN